jgi:hypothetical protein
MNERTFDCADCGATVTVPVAPGRRHKFCADCVRLRKNLKAQAGPGQCPGRQHDVSAAGLRQPDPSGEPC